MLLKNLCFKIQRTDGTYIFNIVLDIIERLAYNVDRHNAKIYLNVNYILLSINMILKCQMTILT